METLADKPGREIRQNEISLKEFILKIQDWVRYLASCWKLTLLGGFAGYLYATLRKTIYIASSTFVYYGSAESDNWEALKGARWLVLVADDVKRSVQKVLPGIYEHDIVEKKVLASDLAKVLICKKEAAFGSIYEKIVEIAPRSR